MSQFEQFKSRVHQFLTKSGMSWSAFGRKAVRDPQFLFRVAKGRQPTIKTIDRVDTYMRTWKKPAPRHRLKLHG
jgi:predicted transcriptional regulator